MPVEIRVLQEGEDAILAQVAPDVFDHDVIPEKAAEFLADPRHYIAVAIDDDTVIGIASAVSYLHPDKDIQLCINEVGVAPSHRRKGIGKRLLMAIFEIGRELGCTETWLGTEHDNESARALYLSLGGAEEPFVMYTFKLSE